MRVFDGKKFAREKEEELKNRVLKLLGKGVTPKLVSVVVGNVGGGMFYQGLKQKAARSVGTEIEIIELTADTSMNRFIATIKRLNKDVTVNGIMIQLPLPEKLANNQELIINSIDKKKDVDGMRLDSLFVAPVIKAVITALEQSLASERLSLTSPYRVVVVGKKGFVGSRIIRELEKQSIKDTKFDVTGLGSDSDLSQVSSADVVISATGKEGLITGEMVKHDSILIDVGSPKGDMEKSAYEKASFVSPVPGGVGPVTISCLIENLVEATSIIA